jgi:hypothetical protein
MNYRFSSFEIDLNQHELRAGISGGYGHLKPFSMRLQALTILREPPAMSLCDDHHSGESDPGVLP